MSQNSRNNKPPPEDASFFTATGTLESIFMDLLGTFAKIKNGNKHVIVLKDRYYKLNRKIYWKTSGASIRESLGHAIRNLGNTPHRQRQAIYRKVIRSSVRETDT